jgi:hypothetical protein
MTKGGCHESTRFTDGSGAVSPQCRGLRTNLRTVRQGESPAAATGCYQRLVRAIGGTGHCAGPFLSSGRNKPGQNAMNRNAVNRCPLTRLLSPLVLIIVTGIGLAVASAQTSSQSQIVRPATTSSTTNTSGSGQYYFEFRSRQAWDYGHTFVVFGRVGEPPSKKNVAGAFAKGR